MKPLHEKIFDQHLEHFCIDDHSKITFDQKENIIIGILN